MEPNAIRQRSRRVSHPQSSDIPISREGCGWLWWKPWKSIIRHATNFNDNSDSFDERVGLLLILSCTGICSWWSTRFNVFRARAYWPQQGRVTWEWGSSIMDWARATGAAYTRLGYTANGRCWRLRNTWMESRLQLRVISRWWMSFANGGRWSVDFELHRYDIHLRAPCQSFALCYVVVYTICYLALYLMLYVIYGHSDRLYTSLFIRRRNLCRILNMPWVLANSIIRYPLAMDSNYREEIGNKII